jgi:hypothetical protein
MVETKLEKDFEADQIKANAAFVEAMNRQIARGKENVRADTFVDTTPPIGHIRIRGDVIFSSCGSPTAMCFDVGDHHGGAQTPK